MSKPIEVDKIIIYLKELLAKREEAVKKYEGPIYIQIIKDEPQMAIEKIKLDSEIALLRDQITAIEKLV